MTGVVDKERVSVPQIDFTEAAVRELELMLDHDFTLQGQVLRLLISGKKCEGPLYSVGFTRPMGDDLSFPAPTRAPLTVAIDPFSAFYLQSGRLDFERDSEREGFVVTNYRQDKYQGKFWLKKQDLIPPLKNR